MDWRNRDLAQHWNEIHKGETVKLDGQEYINSTFDDVTFDYEGTAPTRMTGATLIREADGHIHVG